MYHIALVCENGASTGMVMRKMQQAAKEKAIDVDIKAYPYSQLDDIISSKDYILLGPQMAFKKEPTVQRYPQYADRIAVMNTMDFGMMRGEKILSEAISAIEALK